MADLHYRSLPDGTKVTVEDNGGDLLQVRVTKGKVHRSIGFTRAEAKAVRELFDLVRPMLVFRE